MPVDRLDKFLNHYFHQDVLMPVLPGLKQPEFDYSNDKWTWERYHGWLETSGERDLGVLLKRLCVIDVDDSDVNDQLVHDFPVLNEVPCTVTNHGFHYWFRRPNP